MGQRLAGLFEQSGHNRQPSAAIKFMETLESICSLYKGMTEQDPMLYPANLTHLGQGINSGLHSGGATHVQVRQASRLFCSLSLLELGVRSKDNTGKAVHGRRAGQSYDAAINPHVTAVLMFLLACEKSKQVSSDTLSLKCITSCFYSPKDIGLVQLCLSMTPMHSKWTD